MATDGLSAQKMVRQSGQLGLDVPLVGSGGQSFTPEVLSDLGDAAEGMYVSLWYATDDTDAPGVRQYLDDLEAAGSLDLSDDLSKLGWVAFELLDQVATGLDTIDRTTVLDALNGTSAFDSGGLTPVLDFTTPGTLLSGPRFVNDTCVYAQVEDGAIVAISKGFVEPFAA
jgi:ABC-type branched-subunit amino acid transport system substrate-binding protein